jgi:HAD superfamily hydrolase (TIGR01509 family)
MIFDCDGVLVDSELIACDAVAHGLAEIGIEVSSTDISDRYIGMSASSMYLDLEYRFNTSISSDQRLAIDQAVQTRLGREVKAIDGAKEAVSQLLDTWRVCVASSGSPERIYTSLSTAGLWQIFGGRVFSAKQVRRGKPAPDLFLLAAEQMRVEPARVVVIEDSAVGAESARAAGMVCLGFAGASHANPSLTRELLERGATVVFSQMASLPALAASLMIDLPSAGSPTEQ